MNINIFALLGFIALIIGIAAISVTIDGRKEFVSNGYYFVCCGLVIVLSIIAFLNKNVVPEYELYRTASEQEVKAVRDSVYVGGIKIDKHNIYYSNNIYDNNYLLNKTDYAYICPGLRLTFYDKVLVVNMELQNKKLSDIKAKSITDDVELNKFILSLNASESTDISYDKSISGILNKDRKEQESDTKEEPAIKEETVASTEATIEDSIEIELLLENIDKLKEDVKEKTEKIEDLENEVLELQDIIVKLEEKLKALRYKESIKISDASIRTIVVSIICLGLLGLFIYSTVVKVNTKSKKELLITASDVKIREGVMLEDQED